LGALPPSRSRKPVREAGRAEWLSLTRHKEGDLAGLFEDVSLGGSADPGSQTEQGADKSQPGVDVARAEERTPRPVLSLPKAIERTGARVWVRKPREPRPINEILDLFRDKTIRRATISDPYALASIGAREAQVQFASDLANVATLRSVIVEYAPDVGDEPDDSSARRAIGALFGASEAARKGATLMPVRRLKRTRDDDFHDRQVMLEVEHAGGAVRPHTLLIGRGLQALYDERWHCSVSYAPPT
jgi:hypothetical protein